MSEPDINKIIRLEEQMKNLDEKVVEGFNDVRADIVRLEESLKQFISSSESKFADKWVEKVVGGGVALVLTSIVFAILALIIQK